MEKNSKKNNTLIKRKNLVLEIKKQGIRRMSKDSLALIERNFKKNLDNLIKVFKENMIIAGRKTLKKSDVQKAFEKIKKEESFWEI